MTCGLSALNGIEWHLMAAQSKGLLNGKRKFSKIGELNEFSDILLKLP